MDDQSLGLPVAQPELPKLLVAVRGQLRLSVDLLKVGTACLLVGVLCDLSHAWALDVPSRWRDEQPNWPTKLRLLFVRRVAQLLRRLRGSRQWLRLQKAFISGTGLDCLLFSFVVEDGAPGLGDYVLHVRPIRDCHPLRLGQVGEELLDKLILQI